MRQHLVLTRGDTRDVTLTMPDGAQLTQAESITFTVRDEDHDVMWTQEVTPTSDTVATATIGAAEWTDFGDDSWETRELPFDFQVVDADGETHTPGHGLLTILGDQSR